MKNRLVAVLATLAIGMVGLTAAAHADTGYSQDPDHPTLVTDVPEGFAALGDPAVTEDNCITTTTQVYSRTTEGQEGEVQTTDWLTEPPAGDGWVQIDQRTVTDEEAVPDTYTEWSEWAVTQSGLLTEPSVPANTDVHEWQVTGPVSVGNGDATEDHYENLQWFVYTGQLDGTPERDDPNWHAVPALPNGLPHDPAIGGIYNVSHSDNGRGSWFKYDGDFVPGTPETFHDEWSVEERTRTLVLGSDAVTHEEYRYQRTLTGTDDVTEYVYTVTEQGVSCNPPHHNPPHNNPPHENPPTDTPDVPTVVDAGL